MSSPSYVEAVAQSHGIAKAVVHRYVDDPKPEEFFHQPVPGANHAAWIVGHLARTARQACEGLGLQDLPPLPQDWDADYRITKTMAPAGQKAGDPKELLRLFDLHEDRLIAGLKHVDAAKLAEPPSFQSPLFSNRGQMIHFLSMHAAMHAGQLSVIRRSLGKPPIT